MNHYTPEWSRFVAQFNGHKVSLLDLKSFAHKAMRDGDENAALAWMRLLYVNGAKCWKQLCVYAIEDIGLADLSVMDKVLLLKKRIHRLGLIYNEVDDGHTEWLAIVLATLIVCRAKKNRVSDDAAGWFNQNPTWMPAITQEVFDAAKKASEDIANKKLPPVPDKSWDKHTARGRAMGRGPKHFQEVSSKLKDEAVGIAPFVPPVIDIVPVPPQPKPKKARPLNGTKDESRKVNAIGWCEKTWNVVVGCSRVSAGCENCYAVPECQRMAGNPKFGEHNPYKSLVQIKRDKLDFTGTLHFFENRLETPLTIDRPTVWFVNSLSDMYHHSLPLDTIKRIFEVMNKAHWHTFQILTKRGDRMLEVANQLKWTPNIWQGVTFEGIPAEMAEGQRKSVLSRIPNLRQHPADVKFISFEPLVGPIPGDTDLSGIDWVFFGGESHRSPSQARPMDLGWLRDGIALCKAHGVKPHVKQLGAAWAIASGTYPSPKGTDKSLLGKYRMGKISDVWPSDLRPYAIDSMREVTPNVLAESLLPTPPASPEPEPPQTNTKQAEAAAVQS